jgi:hypothetical protein
MIRLQVSDFTADEWQRAQALDGVLRFEEITDPASAAFDQAYRFLDAFFGAKGELEDRDALAGLMRERWIDYGNRCEGTYHVIAAWHGDTLVGVRDCYVDIDLDAELCLVALSHSLVAPAWRRSGLAAWFRAVPGALSRQVLQARFGRPWPTLVGAEMEPVDPADESSIVRLLSYGRAGFRALDPQRFRYSQPDFRCLPGTSHTGIAMVGVVRPIGLPDDALPPEVCAIYPRLFHACHRMYLPAAQVDPSESHALTTLAASPEPVRLLDLPRAIDDHAAIAPLTRDAVWPLYPPGLRGPAAALTGGSDGDAA